MQSWSRRTALGVLAGSPLAGLGICSHSIAAAPGLRLPDRPMRLSRRLVRDLNDGNRIVVERDWLIAFVRQGRGLTVEGRQLDVRVEAPERIAEIAEIERKRSTEGQFPVLLDADGLVVSAAAAGPTGDISAAVAAAKGIIARSNRSASQKAQAQLYLAQIQRAGASMFAQMPGDLFFPRHAPVRDVQPVNLPDGTSGEFEVVYSAKADPVNGWLDEAERRIITRLAGTSRSSAELWQMHAS